MKRAMLDGKPALVIGGGSPVATMWAAYELAERWGVRYLVGADALPAKRDWDGLPEADVVMEPNMRIRCWRLVNDLADGPVSWSLQENQRFLHQIAKMKYNRIHVQVWPIQPFVHYTFRGMEKPPGVLYFGQKHPIDDDTIGQEKFGEMKVFTKHMEQAQQDSQPEGREYIDCFVGRLRFAVRYLDAADAFGATATAEKANKLDNTSPPRTSQSAKHSKHFEAVS